MLKKIIIAAVIVASNFGLTVTTEAADFDSKSYNCGCYDGYYYGKDGGCYDGYDINDDSGCY